MAYYHATLGDPVMFETTGTRYRLICGAPDQVEDLQIRLGVLKNM